MLRQVTRAQGICVKDACMVDLQGVYLVSIFGSRERMIFVLSELQKALCNIISW